MRQLGKLSKVEVREIWRHEAKDFSAWLVKPENLALLSEELGLEIEPVGTEQSAGRFKIDILAKESNSGDYIIIENQLEPTNHDHLGKVITYAAGYDAKYLIWIVEDVLEEHQRAIEWLNDHLDDNISCFLIRIEVWQIADSLPAPRFEIISLKNNWASNLKRTAIEGELSELQLKQQVFWEALVRDFKLREPTMKMYAVSPKHWQNFSLGNPICHAYLTIKSTDQTIGCNLWTTNKEFFEYLKGREQDLREDLTYEFRWLEANKSGGLRVEKQVVDIFDEAGYAQSFEWLFETLKKFQEVLPRYVNDYRAETE